MRRRDPSPGLSRPAYSPVTYDPTLTFVHPALAKAFAYWTASRGERAMPTRADIRPQHMRGFLPLVALIEVQPRPGREPDYFVRAAPSRRWSGRGTIARSLRGFRRRSPSAGARNSSPHQVPGRLPI